MRIVCGTLARTRALVREYCALDSRLPPRGFVHGSLRRPPRGFPVIRVIILSYTSLTGRALTVRKYYYNARASDVFPCVGRYSLPLLP